MFLVVFPSSNLKIFLLFMVLEAVFIQQTQTDLHNKSSCTTRQTYRKAVANNVERLVFWFYRTCFPKYNVSHGDTLNCSRVYVCVGVSNASSLFVWGGNGHFMVKWKGGKPRLLTWQVQYTLLSMLKTPWSPWKRISVQLQFVCKDYIGFLTLKKISPKCFHIGEEDSLMITKR